MVIESLVVAEKDSVAKAIAMYLSQGNVDVKRTYGIKTYWFTRDSQQWVSVGLRGHIMNLDFSEELNKWHLVEPSKLFDVEPILVIREDNTNYVKALAYLGARAKTIYLALDADPEGEAIAYEVMIVVSNVNPKAVFRRVLFSAVTRDEIIKAFDSLTNLSPGLARRVFTRMMLDLTLGAVFTRALTLSVERSDRKILSRGSFLSYGPCQTPVLNLVVRRALERENFKPEKYYTLHIIVDANGNKITLNHDGTFKARQDAEKILDVVKSAGSAKVVIANYQEEALSPPIPLDTIELERRASKFLNIRPKAALDIAEELYRHGYISYPRTETTIYPQTLNLKQILLSLSHGEHSDYVKELLNSPIRPTRGDSNDGAHPPIYPTKGVGRRELLRYFKNERYWRIYDLVVRHFLATLSPPARVERQKVVVEVAGHRFNADGLRIIERGYLVIYPFESPSERVLPRLRVGEELRIEKAWVEERETEPPPYLSESELLRLMRRYGIGTDATMQDHIHTNIIRGYFRVRNKQCIPTPLGKAVISVLSKTGGELIDPWFRSRMEKALMEITRGSLRPGDVLFTFKSEARKIYEKFSSKQSEVAMELVKALKESLSKGGRNRKASN
ncbi:DNA topoisomerase [Vulcanisaeta souniana]|uniref:DNA topoisomerase n=1 Tax=Vulcanisaeta souniana JCM 11219 TaxID=1293586 RepID=A0A830EG07_9CREN|nr:DNA topoisomerase [Vulcanisaeta souniana]BDR92846.1 DNA topoisomerase III [Vulcanisaeta souniana JCM 11219]GGI81699.1 DNA topoisomerase III [Vulcanisaeta souniana JCM 11219]